MGLSLNSTMHYNKWTKYGVLFKENNAAVILRVAFNTQVGNFTGNMTKIQSVSDRANVDLGGMTEAKDNAKLTAANAIAAITTNGYSFASVTKLTAMKKQMKNSTSAKLVKEKDEDFVSRCNNLNTVLTGALADYPTAADYFAAIDIAAAMVLVGTYEKLLGVWAVAETDVNNAKIEFEYTWMPAMAELLVVLEGMLPGTITTTFPKFVTSFISLKKLVKVGGKTQGVQATMEDAETGDLFINTGKMETLNYIFTKKQKVAKTNSSGLFPMMKLRVGIWKIQFSAPGYVSQIIEVTIEARKVLQLDVLLVAIEVAPPVVEPPVVVV